MMQLLQTMMADREVERAERQANITALQQIAQNNQGHGNNDHPGSKLKNFQHTNPPMFNKTEEPLDADDWLQTMENNLEVAGVEAAEKVLFATHYLSGPARAWWTSARAMNAGQMMTWEDFKLKFSKYHVPQGLIKKMRDEFRELKQGRMSVVEYRDRFLTLSRYAPDETDTNEKRKERFLNGLHDEMQTVLVNIPFADLEALVDSAIQMEGKLHQANENRKRRMMNQNGPHNAQKHRNNHSGGFTPRNNRPPAQTYRPHYANNNGGPPKTGGNNNNSHPNNNNHNNNSNNNGNNNNTNTAPRTGSNATSFPKTSPPSTAMNVELWVTSPMSAPRSLPGLPPIPQHSLSSRFGRRDRTTTTPFLPHDATEAGKHPRPCQLVRLAPPPPEFQDRSRRRPQLTVADLRRPGLATATRRFAVDNAASPPPEPRGSLRRAADPLPRRRSELPSPVDNDDSQPCDLHLIQRRTLPVPGLTAVFNGRPSSWGEVLILEYVNERFHVGAGIPGVAPHYIPPPSTFDVLLGSSWFDKPWFLSEGKLAAVRIIPSSWGCPTNV
ncbi:hypothetical protein QYE76_059105 [Lolium multiflorum]|uniref:Retrotransposon gag domain-containing protein n=1 Tax=Lolium multiflorum TaxID=4521 RepID=A0AAD8WQM5_LOLMU|nr:hypothetical protein QYE76_059105 [Lolium multiflorum]